MKTNTPYFTLTWKSAPRSNNNIFKFNSVTAIIKNKDTGLYLALEFTLEIFWLVWWKVEKDENRDIAIIREVEEETWYKNAKIKKIIIKDIFARWYKPRKDREEECFERVYLVEVEDKNSWKVLWADIWTEGIFWFSKSEILDKLTLSHHIHYFKEYLKLV